MIVYSATREEFTKDVYSNCIEHKILAALKDKASHSTTKSEIESWKNSMQYMNNVLVSAETPNNARVAVEYKIPLTSKRVDFILTGCDESRRDTAVIVELKQWSHVDLTEKDAIVETFVGGAKREMPHPSYQAWTYAALIQDFNETVQQSDIQLRPCAYLHNCESELTVKSSFYAEHTTRAPAFLKADFSQLRDFVEKYVKYGDTTDVLYRIDNGRLKPSKNLVDHLLALMNGNKVFQMIDDQKIVYETALQMAENAKAGQKQVLLVEGGPGTGKSVVAINLLVDLTQRELLVHYVSRNAAPRAVYESKLTGSFTKSRITNLFKGSGAYLDAAPNSMDVLVVDEAHRLNEKSGLYQNLGENQIKEIIDTAKLSIFFIDEDQRVTLRDIGEKGVIREWAIKCGASVRELALESQFRCNGSDGYLAWVNSALQIASTANETLEGIDYDFRVCDSPNKLRELIVEKNNEVDKARLVAGYCWDWKGKKNPDIKDVVIPEHGFEMRWNLNSYGGLWLVTAGSIDEVGCIHTCQGLELDYVGVIFGRDFVVRNGIVVTDATARSSQDRSIHGYKKMLVNEPIKAKAIAERVIKNTYRTLMTRGQKGCYLYCVDGETNEYFQEMVSKLDLQGRTSVIELPQAAEEHGRYGVDR